MVERVRLKTKRVRLRERKRANKKKFTEKNVLQLPVRSKQYVVWDTGTNGVKGLAILVSPGGVRSYRSYYYFPGSSKPHSRNLGRVGEMSLAKARDLCRADRSGARAGTDPRASDPSKSDSYESAVNDYVTREQTGRKQNTPTMIKETKRILLRLSLPPSNRGIENVPKVHPWYTRPLATIRAQEIQRELDLLRDGDKSRPGYKARPYLANGAFGRLRTFFLWCAKPSIGKITNNPMLGIDKPFTGNKRRERAWFKEDAADIAIRNIWNAAVSIKRTNGRYIKCLLLTGKRKTALAEMRWEHISDDWFWSPPNPGKNKRLHGIPLTRLVVNNLGERKKSGFVFDSGFEGTHIYVNGSLLQDKIIRRSGIKDFFLHGIRHLMETKMGELGVLPHIRDMILDHAPPRGSGSIYDHGTYKKEMRTALELWEAHIESLVSEPGVAVLR